MDQAFDTFVSQWLADHRQEFIDQLLGLIAIESVEAPGRPGQPYGPETARALDFMLSLCRDAGLETADLDGHCGIATHGTGGKLIGVLTHLDVVPLGQGWTHAATGELVEDRIYGRGATDDKGPAMASLFALRALMASGAATRNRIRLIFGCHEESGMDDIRYYLTKEPAPDYAFSPDASFPAVFAEKNIISGAFLADLPADTALKGLSGGSRVNVVPDTAQARLAVDARAAARALEDQPCMSVTTEDGLTVLKARGMASHASQPQNGRNALGLIVDGLCRILPPSDGALPYLTAVRDRIGMTWDGVGLGIACSDEATGSLTFNLGLASLSNGRLRFDFDIRHPVTLSLDDTVAALTGTLQGMGFTVEDISPHPGVHVPLDHPLIVILSEAYRDVTGDDRPPQSMGGGTYARVLPCAVAYGPCLPGEENHGNIHMPDEYARVDDLLTAARIFAHALLRLGNLE